MRALEQAVPDQFDQHVVQEEFSFVSDEDAFTQFVDADQLSDMVGYRPFDGQKIPNNPAAVQQFVREQRELEGFSIEYVLANRVAYDLNYVGQRDGKPYFTTELVDLGPQLDRQRIDTQVVAIGEETEVEIIDTSRPAKQQIADPLPVVQLSYHQDEYPVYQSSDGLCRPLEGANLPIHFFTEPQGYDQIEVQGDFGVELDQIQHTNVAALQLRDELIVADANNYLDNPDIFDQVEEVGVQELAVQDQATVTEDDRTVTEIQSVQQVSQNDDAWSAYIDASGQLVVHQRVQSDVGEHSMAPAGQNGVVQQQSVSVPLLDLQSSGENLSRLASKGKPRKKTLLLRALELRQREADQRKAELQKSKAHFKKKKKTLILDPVYKFKKDVVQDGSVQPSVQPQQQDVSVPRPVQRWKIDAKDEDKAPWFRAQMAQQAIPLERIVNAIDPSKVIKHYREITGGTTSSGFNFWLLLSRQIWQNVNRYATFKLMIRSERADLFTGIKIPRYPTREPRGLEGFFEIIFHMYRIQGRADNVNQRLVFEGDGGIYEQYAEYMTSRLKDKNDSLPVLVVKFHRMFGPLGSIKGHQFALHPRLKTSEGKQKSQKFRDLLEGDPTSETWAGLIKLLQKHEFSLRYAKEQVFLIILASIQCTVDALAGDSSSLYLSDWVKQDKEDQYKKLLLKFVLVFPWAIEKFSVKLLVWVILFWKYYVNETSEKTMSLFLILQAIELQHVGDYVNFDLRHEYHYGFNGDKQLFPLFRKKWRFDSDRWLDAEMRRKMVKQPDISIAQITTSSDMYRLIGFLVHVSFALDDQWNQREFGINFEEPPKKEVPVPSVSDLRKRNIKAGLKQRSDVTASGQQVVSIIRVALKEPVVPDSRFLSTDGSKVSTRRPNKGDRFEDFGLYYTGSLAVPPK